MLRREELERQRLREREREREIERGRGWCAMCIVEMDEKRVCRK